jgi:hypothetical protein
MYFSGYSEPHPQPGAAGANEPPREHRDAAAAAAKKKG